MDSEASRQAVSLLRKNLVLLAGVAKNSRGHYSGLLDTERVVSWLLQFGDVQAIALAIRVLEGIHFISEYKLGKLLLSAIRNCPAQVYRDCCIVPLGSVFDSGSHILYPFIKLLGWNETEQAARICDIRQAAQRSAQHVVLLDDNAMSGTQLVRYFDEMEPDFEGHREHFDVPLERDTRHWLRRTAIHVAVAVELGEARRRIEGALSQRYNITLFSGIKDFTRWFEFGNRLWESDAQAREARALFSGISRELFADKMWSESTLNSRLLGHGNSQKLTVFAHNTPKSVPAALWRFGYLRGVPWIPLFPERDEWSRHEEQIRAGLAKYASLARLILGDSKEHEPCAGVSMVVHGLGCRGGVFAIPPGKHHPPLRLHLRVVNTGSATLGPGQLAIVLPEEFRLAHLLPPEPAGSRERGFAVAVSSQAYHAARTKWIVEMRADGGASVRIAIERVAPGGAVDHEIYLRQAECGLSRLSYSLALVGSAPCVGELSFLLVEREGVVVNKLVDACEPYVLE